MQHGHRSDRLYAAALLRLLAIALATAGVSLTSATRAQDSLPSVSDYRLPSGLATPRLRSQGPIDSDNPVVVTPPETPSASATAPVRPAAPARTTASPGPAATASAAASPRPASTRPPTSTDTGTSTASVSPGPAQATRPSAARALAAAALSAGASSTPAAPAVAAPPVAPSIAWNVHSAREVIGARASGMWPWLAALAFVIGIGITLLVQNALRRRASQADSDSALADFQMTGMPKPRLPTELQSDASFQTSTEPGEFDLRDSLALPDVNRLAIPAALASEAAASPASRPALGLHVNPLDVELAARRMSATLVNAVLSYELIVSNRGSETIGPVTVGGDMIGAHATLPERAQLEMTGGAITPLHKLASLAPGESATLSGEFKLPLAAITPIRSGNAALFVPLARFRVEAARAGAVPLAVNCAFVIGEDQERPGAALRPFRLDLGPRLYSRIGQRELALSA